MAAGPTLPRLALTLLDGNDAPDTEIVNEVLERRRQDQQVLLDPIF